MIRVDLAGIAGAVAEENHINSAVLDVKYRNSSYYLIRRYIKSSELALSKLKKW
jgi:hypothetical protein